jgi:hypothetical protein
MPDFSEDASVEQPAIARFKELGWQAADCFYETFGPGGSLGRETRGEVILLSRLGPALGALNPGLAVQAAWAYSQADNNFGIPVDCDPLEGWIVDPSLYDPHRSGI